MKVSILASGSKGNSSYVEADGHNILIDIGVNSLVIDRKLKEHGISSKDIDIVLLTHTHSDHINGLASFLKKNKPTIYLTEKMYKELSKTIDIPNYIIIKDSIELNSLSIKLFNTSHDAEESFGFLFEHDDKSLVYITDTGYINAKYHKILSNRSMYVMESNHDVELLINGPYPHYLKQRIISDNGHLSNHDASNYLSNFIGEKTKAIILIHLSETNNKPEIALESLIDTLNKKNKKVDKIVVALQDQKTELIEV